MRRLLLTLVVMAVGLAGTPLHARVVGVAHHQLVGQDAEQHQHDEHGTNTARDGGTADSDCAQAGHCSPIQLLCGAAMDAPVVPDQGAWCAPCDVHAPSSRPEASTPPPRLA